MGEAGKELCNAIGEFIHSYDAFDMCASARFAYSELHVGEKVHVLGIYLHFSANWLVPVNA